MKKRIALASLAVAAVCLGQTQDHEDTGTLLRNFGGMVVKPGSQKGSVACVNCQTSARSEWIREGADYLSAESGLRITHRTGLFDIRKPVFAEELALFIVDDPELPMSLVAPEARWALVNVAPLKSEKEPFFRARVKKELSRVFCMLCGGFKSNYPNNLTGSVTTVKDLDTFMSAQIPVDVMTRFQEYLQPFGVKPGLVVTYEDACQQGWAHQPTNKWEKAVWDRVHAIPSKPIKIEYNEKRDKGK